MKKQLLIGLLVCLCVALVFSVMFSVRDIQEGGKIAVRVKPAEISGEPATPMVVKKNRLVAQTPAEVLAPSALFSELPEVSDEVLKSMARFKSLQGKVFSSAEEDSERQRLLSDRETLLSMRDLLLRAEPDEFERDLTAIDMLIKALEVSPDGAREIVESFVFDATVEKAGLAPEEQQYLAELKGEMIYHWIAFEPDRISEIEAKLPGPISRKLMQNAKEIRQANLLESSLELQL
jgi:hypothetical protein